MTRPGRGVWWFGVVAALIISASVANSQRPAKKPVKQFEYWLVELDVGGQAFPSRAVQGRLNKVGAAGWELVQVVEKTESVYWLYLKREAE